MASAATTPPQPATGQQVTQNINGATHPAHLLICHTARGCLDCSVRTPRTSGTGGGGSSAADRGRRRVSYGPARRAGQSSDAPGVSPGREGVGEVTAAVPAACRIPAAGWGRPGCTRRAVPAPTVAAVPRTCDRLVVHRAGTPPSTMISRPIARTPRSPRCCARDQRLPRTVPASGKTAGLLGLRRFRPTGGSGRPRRGRSCTSSPARPRRPPASRLTGR
jgi:hypothetical protein